MKDQARKLKSFDWQNTMIDLSAERDVWMSRAMRYEEERDKLKKALKRVMDK